MIGWYHIWQQSWLTPTLLLELGKVHGQYWAGAADTHHWQVSPLFGDMTGLPPTTVYCGTRELLYPDIRLAFDRLLAAGVDATLRVGTGLNHDWPLMPIPEADAAFEEIAEMTGES
jgi:acetyl esterase/lipase